MTTGGPGSRRWWGLALVAAAQFMVIMDTSIIGVALPKSRRTLGFAPEAVVVLQRVRGGVRRPAAARRQARPICSAPAGCSPPAGWSCSPGPTVAGAAGTVGVELSGRALQGVGAALIAPAALTLLMTLFGSEPKELTEALALYGAAAPAGGTAGVSSAAS